MEMNFFDLITPALSAFLAWFFSKRKYQAEVKKSEIENINEIVLVYKQLAMDLKQELNVAKGEIEDLKARLQKFENEHK